MYTRRTMLKAGLATAAAAAAGAALPLGEPGVANAALRAPNSVPFPNLPVGKPTGAFPFEHLVLVMQENHSFDNYLGMLPRRGQPAADGFTFDSNGVPTNSNPLGPQHMVVFREPDLNGTTHTGSQGWNNTHLQINGGAMDGFAGTGPGSMGYYDEPDIPFYYSLAKTFTLANRWFCSAPCQTAPNRRYYMAGTSSGIISTSTSNINTAYPANGTIWDLLSKYNISWRNYFSDTPTSALILPTVTKHTTHLRLIEQFYLDCRLGTLPAVSLVDSNTGSITDELNQAGESIKIPTFNAVLNDAFYLTAADEEDPRDIQLGENFVAKVVNAVFRSPAWSKTMLIWLYDEHGGYYDHVPPPPAIPPDAIPPMTGPGDQPGGFDMYGPRVPAVVVSPWSRPNAVTNVVHDHTSVLATIEAQWNLPALTYRDANATTLADFIDPNVAAFATPPTLAAPSDPKPGLQQILAHGQLPPPPPTS